MPNRPVLIGPAEGAEVEDEGGPGGRGLGGLHGRGPGVYLGQLHGVALGVKAYHHNMFIILYPIDLLNTIKYPILSVEEAQLYNK
mgnify:CR=1 FL=1